MTGPVFSACEICGADDWHAAYDGPVRDGAYPNVIEVAAVARCGGCGVERLHESFCPGKEFYETDAYRRKLEQDLDTRSHFAIADELQIFTLETLWPQSLRGKTVADVGCAGGSFLDHVAGVADRIVAVEPCDIYHQSLATRGYTVFPYAADAAAAMAGKVDLAVSLQVIEHVADPRAFLADIRPLLSPDGILLLSTPNRDDILMELLPEDFRAFFYRVVHRWYFDAAALAECARHAGFEVIATKFVHRFGMANALAWLRDRRPRGRQRMAAIDGTADSSWRSYLESQGRSDCLYVMLRRAS